MNPPRDFASERLILAPDDPADREAWRSSLGAWRERALSDLAYDGGTYARPEFAWTASCYCCCLAMLWDETLYDRRSNRFTPESFLEHGQREFGGYDAVVLWHAYPVIGFDDRNQFDHYRTQPGGLAGLRDLIDALHARGVRAFLDYNPWDTGTRPEPGGHLAALAETVAATGADGVFLDTMRQGSAELRARLDAAKPGVALESESTLPIERLHDHQMSWAQWYRDGEAPGVLRNRWLERRHMMHHTRRWERDHSEELHGAWMNGAGVLVWENVFGAWNGWNPRDRAILRAMLPVQRHFTPAFQGEGWTPLVATEAPRVHASRWDFPAGRLWTLVNRADTAQAGPLLAVDLGEGESFFDALSGEPLRVERRGREVLLHGRIPARGIAALLAVRGELDASLVAFLERQKREKVEVPDDTTFPALIARALGPDREPPAATTLPEGMLPVPAWSGEMSSTFRKRECGTYDEAPFVDEWKPLYPNLHSPVEEKRQLALEAFAIDAREVTNAQFLGFLEASAYQPRFAEGFLAHWREGRPAPGSEDEPVVNIDLEDARAYATWAGRRLPSEWEWQRAFTLHPLPQGPRVWSWTESERTDGRTRYCILKNGSDYLAEGSEWYADGGPQAPHFSVKLLLGAPSVNRRPTVGFRCASSLAEDIS